MGFWAGRDALSWPRRAIGDATLISPSCDTPDMDIERSTALTLALLVVAVVAFTVPLLVPPADPENTVTYSVEQRGGTVDDRDTLVYAEMSEDEQAVFDAARTAARDVHYTPADTPPRLTPDVNALELYTVRYEESYYAMQVRHSEENVDFLTQHFPRLLGIWTGLLLGLVVTYRRFG